MVLLLFFVKLDPYYEGIVLFTVLCMLLTALLLLIRDMDNPFEVGKKTYADIDMFLLWDLEKKLNVKTGFKGIIFKITGFPRPGGNGKVVRTRDQDTGPGTAGPRGPLSKTQ